MQDWTIYIPLGILGVLLFTATRWVRHRENPAASPRMTIGEAYCRGVYRLGCAITAHAKAMDRYLSEYKAVRSRDRWEPMHRHWTESQESA